MENEPSGVASSVKDSEPCVVEVAAPGMESAARSAEMQKAVDVASIQPNPPLKDESFTLNPIESEVIPLSITSTESQPTASSVSPSTEVEVVGDTAATKKRKKHPEFTNQTWSRRKKTDKVMQSPATNQTESEAATIDENMKSAVDGDYLHVFPVGAFGKDKLASVPKSEFTKSTSEFNGKIAMFVDVEHHQQDILYSDFKRYQNEENITSAVVNTFSGC